MSFDNSTITKEISQIQANIAPREYMYSGTIHANDVDYPILKIKSYIRLRDYANNKSDKVELVATIGIGTYNNVVRRNRGALEITIRRSEATSAGSVEFVGGDVSVERFIAVPPEEPEKSMYDSLSVDTKEEDADKLAVIDVSFELTNPTIMRMRGITVGGLYTSKDVGQLLLTLMTAFSRGLEVDTIKDVKGVDLIPGYNTTPRKSFEIPHHINLLDLPSYVHKNCGGVYSAGLGWYLQDYLWYIYPLYDTTRFDKERSTLTVILLPENKQPFIKNSFKQTDTQLSVIITRAPRVFDDTEAFQLNAGNGVRFADASKVMSGFGNASDNKYTVEKQQNVYEVVANNRTDGLNLAPIANDNLSDNPFVEYSRLARGKTVHVQFEWLYSDDRLLYPGMPVRIIRWVKENIKEEYGTLLGSESFNLLADNAQTDQYVQRTVLTVGVAKTH